LYRLRPAWQGIFTTDVVEIPREFQQGIEVIGILRLRISFAFAKLILRSE